MSITRRLFLRNTAVAGAVGATVAAPALAQGSEPRTPRDQAIWHMREIERLMFEHGADTVHLCAIGTYGHHDNCRLIGIHHDGFVMDRDGVFGECRA